MKKNIRHEHENGVNDDKHICSQLDEGSMFFIIFLGQYLFQCVGSFSFILST